MKADVQSQAEKEALEWATDLFRDRADDLHPGEKEWLNDKAWLIKQLSDGRDDRLREALDVYIHNARGGYREYIRALCDFAAWLTERGIALPAPMRHFIAEFLRNPKMSRKRGRNSSDLWARNFAIGWAMVQIVKRWKFPPTRNEVTEPASAASIVRMALDRGPGIHLSEKSINRIWGDFQADQRFHPDVNPELTVEVGTVRNK
jgi:hypothetical protein